MCSQKKLITFASFKELEAQYSTTSQNPQGGAKQAGRRAFGTELNT